MEQKSIGTFIASERRAKGMTQKQLAQQLHVSDKAISRWELDQAQPDLTQVPVMAKIFGVTSDELLQGFRNENPHAPKTTEIHRSRLQKCTLLSAVLGLVGFMTFLVFTHGFKQHLLGFVLSLCFYLSGTAVHAFSTFKVLKASEAIRDQEQAVNVLLRVSIYHLSLVAGTLPFLKNRESLETFLIFFPFLALPTANILIRLNWLVLKPLIASKGPLFQTERKGTAIWQLRKSTLYWDLLISFILAWTAAVISPHRGVAFAIIMWMLVLEMPVNTGIYIIRIRKLQ